MQAAVIGIDGPSSARFFCAFFYPIFFLSLIYPLANQKLIYYCSSACPFALPSVGEAFECSLLVILLCGYALSKNFTKFLNSFRFLH